MLKVLLFLHVVAGATAFVVAPITLAVAKGGRTHRFWGKIYFWAMAFVAASALILSAARPTLFLALVSVFSFYLAFSGYRVLGMKKTAPEGLDWGAAVFTFLASAVFVGLAQLAPKLIQGQAIVGTVFGVLGMAVAARSIYMFLNRPKDKMFWWYQHMRGFLGSYIAAWSAFSVNVVSGFAGPHWWVWLWPVMLGVPASIIWVGYYRHKFSARASAAIG